MTDDRTGILLTGATGFLGGEILARLLERRGGPVYALVRAGSDSDAQARLDSVVEADLVVRERAPELPVQVVRPSIVVGDSRSGWTPAFNVLYTPLRAFSRGAYPMVPARRSSPVDVVPVDYVADSVLALAGRAGQTHHLVAGQRASSVGEIIDLASDNARLAPP